MGRFVSWGVVFVVAGGFGWLCGELQSADRAPSSPAADGSALPRPDPSFDGRIGQTYEDSQADFPQPIKAPQDAPNVLIILLDDVGFGHASTFGGPIPTPALDRLAAGGLRYNCFHTTALCSPTRAALLAGRNHHSVGSGVIIEMGTGFPGYTGIIPRSAALVPEILRQNGFATAALGKWHNTPEPEISPAGPFDRWPTGLGFDYFYGFNQGETNQYNPVLYRNTTPVAQPAPAREGYHLTTDLTDQAIDWTRSIRATNPDQPWFLYYSTGAAHAPHHAPRAWREKFRGQFDQGWDRLREETHARQLELGVIPPGTQLTPRPADIPAWDDQPEEAREVYCRLMENFAGFLAHTDDEVGRMIDALEQSGELDNTLIFYIVGDNGPSAEGGLEGTFNEPASLLGVQLGLDSLRARIDEIGEAISEPHVPVGWAWAGSTPFQWTKQVASHFGGTRNPMVIHWPARIKDAGGLRSQFHHCIDIVPTILEATGVAAPESVNGIPQKPFDGVSMVYTFDADAADAPSRRTTQYFEMFGNRGVYHDGWVACARHGRLPWGPSNGLGFDEDRWELYHVAEDFSQARDLADEQPRRLKQLQALFLEEAGKFDVLPLDDRFSERLDPAHRGSDNSRRTEWTYYGNAVWLPEPIGPLLTPRSHTIAAELVVPEAGADGVIACVGGQSGGWSLFVLEGRLTYRYNFFDFQTTTIQAEEPLPTGDVQIAAEFVGGAAGGGTLRLLVGGEEVASGEIERTTPRHSVEPFEVGRDSISPVAPEYADQGDFAFAGRIERIRFALTK